MGSAGNFPVSTLITARSSSLVTPTMRAGTILVRVERAASKELSVLGFGKTTCTRWAPFTTCALVTMYPLSSTTKPDPMARCRPIIVLVLPRSPSSNGPYPVTRICTTLGDTFLMSASTDWFSLRRSSSGRSCASATRAAGLRMPRTPTMEDRRLEEARMRKKHWKRWGPYLSERQWGTVREDYSANGTAWEYFPHDHACSRAYRWGEDGIGGISDRHQMMCFGFALWNGRDAILKERLFGLTGNQGNHGEDVKVCYFYLDSTPTHSYMRMLYKYPQAEFPYGRLVEENKRRGRGQPEFELLDTGVFSQNRYFDVFVEYAKADVEDILIRITAVNRGPEAAALHVLPQFWFRNTWSWGRDLRKPAARAAASFPGTACVELQH